MLMFAFSLRSFIYSVCALSHIAGLLLFMKGFFPSKVVLDGFNEFEKGESPFGTGKSAQFEKFVLVVVDAMRSDFLYSEKRSQMNFVHELINKNIAIPFTAFSNPPTVTLPRLKGITTGGPPNFLDAILNVADDKDDSQGLSNQDSWIHQFVKGKKKIVNFYGDDTWLKLFPGDEYFKRTEGTGSFFVSDFTEVDNNVTRHIENELSSGDWDGLILHYLGLDHIGHKGGPDSPYMKDKQIEMDTIIRKLYNYTSKKDALLIVMGDHGMNEIGNHGGSSLGETSAGLVFVSPKFQALKTSEKAPQPDNENYKYFTEVQQIDLVPTLAAMFNFPIPKNSLGVIIKDFLELWKKDKSKIEILKYNCKQIMNLYDAKYSQAGDTKILKWWTELQKSENIDEYYSFLIEVQDLMASSATNYNYEELFWALSLTSFSVVLSVSLFNWYFFKDSTANKGIVLFFQSMVFIYSLHFHGSSLIEEEHQIWWFLCVMSFILFYAYTRFQSSVHFIIVIAGARLIKAWNNSGQKYTSRYTIGALLLDDDNVLWLLILLTYTVVALMIHSQGAIISCFQLPKSLSDGEFGAFASFVISFVTCSISFLFKLCQFYNDGNDIPKWLIWLFNFTTNSFGIADSLDNNTIQKMNNEISSIVFYCISSLILLRILLGKLRGIKYGMLTDVSNIVSLLLVHQSRIENIPMFLILFGIKFAFSRIIQQNRETLKANIDEFILIGATFTLIMQNLSFFAVGNTNSLATVDLSNAYNGIKTYDVFVVGLLTFISTYNIVIFWSLSFLQLLFETSVVAFEPSAVESNYINFKFLKKPILLVKCFATLMFYSVGATNLLASCYNLRYHLFIWTVFSPKLLYFAAWSILINFGIDSLLSTILVSIA